MSIYIYIYIYIYPMQRIGAATKVRAQAVARKKKGAGQASRKPLLSRWVTQWLDSDSGVEMLPGSTSL